MYFQIRGIILWPRNKNFKPHTIRFELGKVNVISGASRTGKSAVIPIIDYCLGANTCSIPVKTIRKYCEWFGIVVATEQGEKLLARKEPGNQRSTTDMFVLEAENITSIPIRLEKNTNVIAVKRMLDDLANLSNLDFSGGDENSGFDGRPAFRDLAAFTFQPQNVVANPDVLFFKTNTYEHREKLRKIFPYVLGAITSELMAKQFELNRTRLFLRRKERELKDAQDVSAQWLADLKSKYSEAQELGLVPKPQEQLSRKQMISQLEEVISRTDLTLKVTVSTISDALSELNALESEERLVSRELTTMRHRLEEMNRLRVGMHQYENALLMQRDRLKISGWLLSNTNDESDCPMCGSHTDSAKQKLQALVQRLSDVEAAVGADTHKEVPAAFDRELQRVTTEVANATERLRAIQSRKRTLTSRSKEAREQQFSTRRAERFIGNVESALELHRKLGSDSELVEEVRKLKEIVQTLEKELREKDVELRKNQALRVINAQAGNILQGLDVEDPSAPISLEINDLTIKVLGDERDDYLSEIGSGSNWLSYHLAILLSLHQFYLSQKNNPVPSFLILDQPSQVYFPKTTQLPNIDNEDEPKLRDEDVEAVRRAFKAMGNVVIKEKGKLQLIVLDHAPREVWGEIDGVVGLPEWRDGIKLVPMEWLTGI
ncbi:DUF3732 domain-containing protein [Salmonella enterica subsp. enterica serovar Oslo]|nr:DUF3732 domain-containing protein [Salmonella enterica subsp. enterica serovar Oslo]ECZ6731018.1 DUF3732 domain-containing protein [Salmonella enterica]EDR2105456.1 DUF3732 domain-containing protein [Salmonella enterica subsp. enterica]ECG6793993.1 DUF3732 domain-containing protein [Salmonella enterica subsp. enterica serovar Oslo]ECU8310353.1 DUF3732 domain-containing protein [Salmonella enterica subsp. enterica serovar Oslo]